MNFAAVAKRGVGFALKTAAGATSVTALRKISRTNDPNPTESTTDYPCTIVNSNYSLHLVAQGIIQTSSVKATILADGLPSGVSPSTIDRVVIDGVVLTIRSVRALRSGGVVIAYSCELGK